MKANFIVIRQVWSQMPLKRLLALALPLVLVCVMMQVDAFGGPKGGPSSNPFFSPATAFSTNPSKQDVKAIKDAANALLPEPTPGERLKGPNLSKFIADSNCTFGMIHKLNENRIYPALSALVRTAFFRYFKVSLASDCPFWAMNRICTSGGGCTVCQCDENEVPQFVRNSDAGDSKAIFKPLPLDFKKWDDDEVDGDVWAQTQIEYRDPDATYVNLLDNPESNTGYSGDEPRMIWDAIYRENCFKHMSSSNVAEMCREEQVFYRLISGLHTSITVHVFARWKRVLETDIWRGNQGVWNQVFGRFPERLDNLYFTLSFLLRTLQRLSPKLEEHPFDSGNALADARTQDLMSDLIKAARTLDCRDASSQNLPKPSVRISKDTNGTQDEVIFPHVDPEWAAPGLFSGADGREQKQGLRNMFRNVSMIINCVSCEKCRVWGKLNILGLGTALKVMSAEGPEELEQIWRTLQRNELVAFVNTIGSFSEAVAMAAEYSLLEEVPERLVLPSASKDGASDPGESDGGSPPPESSAANKAEIKSAIESEPAEGKKDEL